MRTCAAVPAVYNLLTPDTDGLPQSLPERRLHSIYEGTDMPTLKLTKLECVKKRDPIGKDEIDTYVTVDEATETFLSGPHFLDKSKNDDEVTLGATKDFNEKIRISLRERDGDRGGNNDLVLSPSKTVYQDEKHNITYTAVFTANNGRVVYHLSYMILD